MLYHVNLLLSWHNLLLPKQSAYCKFCSTEIVLVDVHSKILSIMDNGEVTAIILLHLSAAIDPNVITFSLFGMNAGFGFGYCFRMV